MKKVAMAYVVCISHCNLFSTIAEGFRTPSPFSGITSKGRISNDFFFNPTLLIIR